MKKIIIFSIASICWIICLQAQSDSAGKSKVQFKFSANYCSNFNYYGRTDSLKSSGVFPLAELWFNKNFYINAAPIFVNNKISSFEYAGTVTSLGYQILSNNKKWFGNFYIVKPFYESNAQLVQSSLKGQVALAISSLNKILDVSGGADVKLSDKVDFGLTCGVDHIFRKQFADKAVLVIDPSAYLFAGTQQFSTSTRKTNSLIPIVIPNGSQQVTNFNILSYEFSIPVILAAGKFQVLFTPAYVIPQNLILVAGRPDLSETGQQTFYVTTGVKFML